MNREMLRKRRDLERDIWKTVWKEIYKGGREWVRLNMMERLRKIFMKKRETEREKESNKWNIKT